MRNSGADHLRDPFPNSCVHSLIIYFRGGPSRDEAGTEARDIYGKLRIHFNRIRIHLKDEGKTLGGFKQGQHDQIHVLETASVQCGKWAGGGRPGEGFGHNLPERLVATWIGVVAARVESGQIRVAFGKWDGQDSGFFLPLDLGCRDDCCLVPQAFVLC